MTRNRRASYPRVVSRHDFKRDDLHHKSALSPAIAQSNPAAYKKHMPCEIFHVPFEESFRWKWRQLSEDGSVNEQSEESYELYYECVCAARQHGYKPKIKCA